MKEEVRRITAGVLAAIYITAMHPMLLYGEGGGAGDRVSFFPEKVVEEAGELIGAETGGTVRLGETEVEIPAGALERDTEIKIQRLLYTEDTGEGLAKVTAGGGGYRFLPAGTEFMGAVRIKMGYSAEVAGNAEALEDMRTYYYDEKGRRWEKLDKAGIEEERQRIISETTHFTDMINGTLTLPEGPKPLSFNINSIKGLEAANPGAGVPKLEGLEGDSTGAAGFQIGLEVPGGRRGMQPVVKIGYSSDGGNGIMGRGFDLQAGGRITTDTRWGLPRYNGEVADNQLGGYERDTYILDGVILKESKREEKTRQQIDNLQGTIYELSEISTM
jgi:hypothetical protein